MKWGRISLVIFGALFITALSIDAADTIQGKAGTLLSQVLSSKQSACPAGMVEVGTIPGVSCVDAYEESANEKCAVAVPEQMLATQKNIESKDCFSESKVQATPWRFITRDQAMQMCARSGKRLPTSAEWYLVTIGMADVEHTCNISSKQIAETGTYKDCVSPLGIHDLVGNVWEWVSDDVFNGQTTRPLPSSGYVSQVDAQGMPVAVSDQGDDLFGKDYFWSRAEGTFGMIRGGYYDSGTDGGMYTVHADTLPTSASIGVGFRCVK